MAFCNSSMFVTSFCVLDSSHIPCIILPASSSSLTDCQLASIVLTATTELHIFISSLHSTQTGSRALAIHGFSSQVRNRCLLASVHFVFWAPLLLVLIDCVDSSLLIFSPHLLSTAHWTHLHFGSSLHGSLLLFCDFTSCFHHIHRGGLPLPHRHLIHHGGLPLPQHHLIHQHQPAPCVSLSPLILNPLSLPNRVFINHPSFAQPSRPSASIISIYV